MSDEASRWVVFEYSETVPARVRRSGTVQISTYLSLSHWGLFASPIIVGEAFWSRRLDGADVATAFDGSLITPGTAKAYEL